MSLAGLLSHSVTVRRAAAAGGVKKTYQTIAEDVPCLIQPLDPEATASVGMAMGKAYKIFFQLDANVQEGDSLLDHQGRTLGVRGIRRRDYGRNQHLDVLVEEDKAA